MIIHTVYMMGEIGCVRVIEGITLREESKSQT